MMPEGGNTPLLYSELDPTSQLRLENSNHTRSRLAFVQKDLCYFPSTEDLRPW